MTVEYKPGMTLADLPLPDDARPTRKWPQLMLEISDHIGPAQTLRLIDAHGGTRIYVPIDPEHSPFQETVSVQAVKTMAQIYGGSMVELPLAAAALKEARRAAVLASVRNRDMKPREAAKILGATQRYVAKLANTTDEGSLAEPLHRPRLVDSRQIDMFAE